MTSLKVYPANETDSFIHDQKIKGETLFGELRYDRAEIVFSDLIPVFAKKKDWKNYCLISNMYVMSLWRQDKISDAEEAAHQTLDRCNKYLGKNNPELVRCYINLGVIYFLSGKTNMSITYFRKSAFLSEQLFGEYHPLTAEAYEWLGTVHESVSDTLLAYQYLTKSIHIWEKVKGKDNPGLANVYRYFGLYYKRFGELDSALFYFNKAKKLYDRRYGKYNCKSVKCLNNICDVYEAIEQFDTARIIYNQALDLLSRSKAPNRYIYMMTNFNIGELYQREGKFTEALKFYQKALTLFFPSATSDDIFSNPDDIGQAANMYVKIILFWKARCFVELSKTDTTKQIEYLMAAYDSYSCATKVIDEIKHQINNYEDLLTYENTNANLMVEMAENALQLYTLTDSTVYYERALQYIERNKQMVLFVSGNPGCINDHIPEPFQRQRMSLETEYNLLLNKLALVDKDNALDSLDEQRINLKIAIDRLSWEINQGMQINENDKKPKAGFSLVQIQDRLQDNQVFINFTEFCDDYITEPDRILSLVISKDQIACYTLDGKDTYNLIMQYYDLISNRTPTEQIDRTGHKLYKKLFGQYEDLIENKNIVIVPSQHVSLVAFDALPVSFSDNGHANYFIEKHAVWKVFSITSFINRQKNANFKKVKVLAMAPAYTKEKKLKIAMLAKRDTSLINLAGAERECKEISKFFNTELITGFDATEYSFKSRSSNFQVIHLATHGVPASSDEKIIKLAFSKRDDDIEDGFLNMYEIFNLDLNAELVVLSACKTGIGKLNKGESNLNLGWAFSKAGARSVIISLWDENDYASSIIMPAFYKYLSDGYTKPEALHQAKLKYLSFSDDLTGNPYFWAGLEYYGNNTRMVSLHTTPDYSFGIIVGGSLILLVVMTAVRKHTSINKEHHADAG